MRTRPLHTLHRVSFLACALLSLGSASGAQELPACPSAEARAFDFWIGEWVVENRQQNPATPEDTTLYPTGVATDRVHAILNGCAIVEHWEGYLAPDRHVLGFSVRTWNPETERWHVLLNWPAPDAPSFFEIEGSFDGDVANFVFPRPRGEYARYRFLDTTGDRPRWEGAAADSTDGPWRPFWVMQFTRRDPILGDTPHTGLSRTTERCSDERARAYDFLLGDWVGKETFFDDSENREQPIEVRTMSILEGCALVDHVTWGEGDEKKKAFRVRSFLPSENQWVQYSLTQEKREFVRHEGKPSDGEHTLIRAMGTEDRDETDSDDPPTLERMRWHQATDDNVIRETAVSADGGVTWRTVSRAELRRR